MNYSKCKNWDEVVKNHPAIESYTMEDENGFVRIDLAEGYGSSEFGGGTEEGVYTITEHAWWSEELRHATDKEKLLDALRRHDFSYIFKITA